MTVLVDEGILADGAIGTEIYRRGVFINRCFDELNLTNRDLIKQIHIDYLNAGAQLLKTNTFTANRAALSAYGLEAKTKDINAAGVRIARKIAGKEVFVGGSVGPVSSSTSRRSADSERTALFAE
ncbi:MAG: homocysteine S-methyltransferase family protein, partial [Bacteroidia bacterium]|nr:homocysteine S-methyltransferase family protein [Bacteroidia bacterium]